MKTITFIMAIICLSFHSHAQSLSNALKKTPVKSIYWGSKTVSFADGFLEMVDKELQKQFTVPICDSIIRYSISMYQPRGWDNEVFKDSIKLYHVATFDNNFGGQFRGKRYVLIVPYAENAFLWKYDATRPNDFFLIFPPDAVELEK